MLTMSQINYIRDLSKMGYGISEIHNITGADPKTIRKYLEKDDFSPSPPVAKGRQSIIAPYVDLITKWLDEDQKHWSKQRHTAKRIYERLTNEHGYTGCYESVQKYVKMLRNDIKSKGTQELVWEPGCAQVDFGEADFYEDNICVRRKYLTVSFPYSNDGYSQVFYGETAECVCQGLKDIFSYIGGVPFLLVFDNATGVGHRVMEQVTETELFSRFHAHYGFQVRFCNPHAGHEKGNVENKIGTQRRNLFVPVPTYHDIEEYNQQLLDLHVGKASELHYKKHVVISELFEEDQKHFLSLPEKEFDVCRYEMIKADGYGKVCVDGKHFYSTKPENHSQSVVVGIRAHYIDIFEQSGELLIRHKREYGDTRTDSCDYKTSLDMLAKNIGAWSNSGFRRDAPDIIRDYIDNQSREDRKSSIRLLSDLSHQYDYETAVAALEMAIENKSENKTDAVMIAAWISIYGLDTPLESSTSLELYDKAFLPQHKEEVTVS